MEDTKDRILAAALELFSEKGYSAVSTKSIARSASVNEVTIFRTFGSKRSLYLEVYRSRSVKMDKEAVLENPRYDLEFDLSALGRAFSSIYSRTLKLVRMSLKDVREEFPEIDRDLRAQIDSFAGAAAVYFRKMRELGMIGEDPERLSGLLSGLLYGYAMHLMKNNAPERLEPDIDSLMEIFARGVRRA